MDTTTHTTTHNATAHDSGAMSRTIRVAATMLAIAAAGTLGAFHAWSPASADSPDAGATYIPIEPCRLFDTRPGGTGPRSAPLGPEETYEKQITGPVGECDIPTEATGVAMNVTVTDGTAASYLTVIPAGQRPIPLVSSLNWTAGQAPFPNKVDARLSPGGAIELFNLAGNVHVIADAVGYYSPGELQGLAARVAELEMSDAAQDAQLADVAQLAGRVAALETAGAIVVQDVDEFESISGLTNINHVSIEAPTDGVVYVMGTVSFADADEHARGTCAILRDGFDAGAADIRTTSNGGGTGGTGYSQIAEQRVFAIDGGSSIDLRLSCTTNSSPSSTSFARLTAIFLPNATRTITVK